jgi:hypothetical protein
MLMRLTGSKEWIVWCAMWSVTRWNVWLLFSSLFTLLTMDNVTCKTCSYYHQCLVFSRFAVRWYIPCTQTQVGCMAIYLDLPWLASSHPKSPLPVPGLWQQGLPFPPLVSGSNVSPSHPWSLAARSPLRTSWLVRDGRHYISYCSWTPSIIIQWWH